MVVDSNEINRMNKTIEVLDSNYNAMLQWVVATQQGYNMCDYLVRNGWGKIAVYGMNDIGNCVVRELLKDKRVELMYVIDQGWPKLYFDVDCYKLNELPRDDKPDLVIVSLPGIFDDVVKDIRLELDSTIMSITEVVFEMSI